MMTYVLMIGSCLSPTSKVPRRDAEILKEAEEGEGKPASWIGYVGEEKKTFDTSFSAPLFLKPSGIQGGLCSCSLPLIRGHPLGIKQVQKRLYLYIYVHGKVIRETRQSVRSVGLVRCLFSRY